MPARLVGVVLLATALFSCSRSNPPSVRLQAVQSCDELLIELKKRAIADTEQAIGNRQNLMILRAVDSPSGSRGATQYSTTNNQVPGVDEPDFVKNDERYIYVLANNSFQVVDAWPPNSTHLISRVAIEGEPKKMFVHRGRAAIFSTLGGQNGGGQRYPQRQTDCSYGYDCDFSGDGFPSKLTLLDLTDPARPQLLREVRFSASFVNARRVDQSIYVVVASAPVLLPEIQLYPSPGTSVDSLKRSNRQIINRSSLADWLPTVVDIRMVDGRPVPQGDPLADCRGFYANGVPNGHAMVSLAALDLDKDGPLQLRTIIGRGGATYATASSLYIAAPQPMSGMSTVRPMSWPVGEETTTVHQFTLAQQPAQVEYAGSGLVAGRVLNQFSMDEHNGALRIATTNGHLPGAAVNAVAILRMNGETLQTVGLLDGLARGEDIRSVRFDGDRGFVVTFKKTDPLFVLDLREAASPRVLGELIVPGFSTYMQLMDPSHLLTIGYDVEDHGSFAFFQGLQLQIFDVGNAGQPTLAHREVIGTRGSSSEAATNHLAFNYFASKNLLALPLVVCEGSVGWRYGRVQFNGLAVYDVTSEAGFHYRGAVVHDNLIGTPSSACASWWTRGESMVKRSLFMDDFVYSITANQIRVEAIDHLGADLAVVSLNP